LAIEKDEGKSLSVSLETIQPNCRCLNESQRRCEVTALVLVRELLFFIVVNQSRGGSGDMVMEMEALQ
jgi:hypothetical protein